jgi:hypothetical protein
LHQLTFGDLIKYRKDSEEARTSFLEMLGVLHAKAQAPASDGDYQALIQRLIETEIRPAAREFKNRLDTIHETLFGKIESSAVRWVGGSGLAQLLTGMSWEHMLMLATGTTIAEAATHIAEARREKKAARRNCAISYVLDVESHGE